MVVDTASGKNIKELKGYQKRYRYRVRYSMLGELKYLFFFGTLCIQVLILIWNVAFSAMDYWVGLQKSVIPILMVSLIYIPTLGRKTLYICNNGIVVETTLVGINLNRFVRRWKDMEGWRYRRIDGRRLRLTHGWGHEKNMLIMGNPDSIDFILGNLPRNALKT